MSSHTDISSTKEDDVKIISEDKIESKLLSVSANNSLTGLINGVDNLSNTNKHNCVVSLNGPLKQTGVLKEQNLSPDNIINNNNNNNNNNRHHANDVHKFQINSTVVPQPNIRKPDSLKLDFSQTR